MAEGATIETLKGELSAIILKISGGAVVTPSSATRAYEIQQRATMPYLKIFA